MAAMAGSAPPVKALTFDVFGTVVDWRSSIIREGGKLGKRKGLQADWAKFADAWRGAYAPSMERVRKGELPWTTIDALHRLSLDKLLADFRIGGLTEGEKDDFTRAWHRLTPWPDVADGLARLRQRYITATLSNGNVSLLVNLSRFGGLTWDCILSAELARRYKPDREVYLTAASLLGLKPEEIMMVAAHNNDLAGARAAGLRTALVVRPEEYGPGGKADLQAGPGTDLVASDFLDLAAKLR
jgi:2-haloacid dehalogenase